MKALYLFLDRNLILFFISIFSADIAVCLKFVLNKNKDESIEKFHRKLDIATAICYSIMLVYVGILLIAEIVLKYELKYLMLFTICLILAIKNIVEAIISKKVENKEIENKKWSKYWRGERK